jgi:hypothetical protein
LTPSGFQPVESVWKAQREAILRHAVLSGYDLVAVSENAGISGSN